MENELKFSLKVILPCGKRFGRGKAELMQNIDTLGSISAAATKMKMSYPRASRLVGEINAMFADQVIETYQGGASKGGACLTEKGHSILNSYLKWTKDICDSSETLTSTFLSPKASGKT